MPLLESNGEEREEQNRQKTSSWDSTSGNLMRSCAICWSAGHKAIAPTQAPSLRLLCTLLLSPQWGDLHSRLLPNSQSCITSQKCGLQECHLGQSQSLPQVLHASIFWFVVVDVALRVKSVSLDANICSDTSHILCLPRPQVSAFTLHV